MRRVYHGFYEDKIPSYPVIRDPLAPVSLVWSGHPLAKINIAQNKGVTSKEGEGPANHAECQETSPTCVLICFCAHLSLVFLTFFAASSSFNILSHLFIRYIFQQDLFIGLLQFLKIYQIRGVYAGAEDAPAKCNRMQTVSYFKAKTHWFQKPTKNLNKIKVTIS